MSNRDASFDNQMVIVSGGATGIGAASVEAFCEQGASVACIDRNVEQGTALVERHRAGGSQVEFFAADVGVKSEVTATIEKVVATLGAPSVLFNHAGTAIVKPFLDLGESDFWNMMRINVFSMFCVSQAVIPHMIKRGGGSIVCTASVSGELATPNEILYCASKAACEMFARGVAVEFQSKNIRCNSISPGFVDTPHGQREIRELRAIGVDVSAEMIEQRQGRLATPRDIADVVVFAASHQARFVNGANIVVDNCFSAQ
jgi:NAD(P)-dependent dehydrogenase (short-subunit alcohol dehydrogenase family)